MMGTCGGRETLTHRRRDSVATASGGYCRKWNITGPIKGVTLTPDGQNGNCSQQNRKDDSIQMIDSDR